MALAEPAEEGIEVLVQAQPLQHNCWAPPTLVGDTLYMRNREKFVAFDLGAE